MIKPSIIITIVFFALYSLWIHFNLNIGASQNQWQDNTIKAQRYIYNNAVSENVIIGTSLTNKLVMDSLPEFENLSLSGESIYDGLNIVCLKKTLPKNLYIEMNFALKNENEEFKSSLSNPVMYKLKKHIYSLREDKQPLAILGNYINTIFLKSFIFNIKNVVTIKDEKQVATDQNAFNKMLDIQHVKYIEEPDSVFINDCFNKLAVFINSLKKQHVNVVFFEMPINKQLIDLPKAKRVRDNFLMRFPVASNNYIFLPENIDDYETTDGIHLKMSEALIYTTYFKKEIKKYEN